MLFICYPKCSTCQKAKAWLQERGVAFDERDIKQDNPTEQELRAWHEKSGLPLKRFFNTSGLQYKALGLKDKLPNMSEEEQLALLVRPVAEKLGLQSARIAFAGSVLQKCAPVRSAAQTQLQTLLPQLTLAEPQGDAAAGAVLLARCKTEE